jgi:hypothetical protein
VIEIARRRGLQGIAITDHDTEEGGLAVREANPYSDFLVIPGVEIKTDLGDLIGLYVTKPIKTRRFAEVAAEIIAQGGFVYLPHPLRTFGPDKLDLMFGQLAAVDAWEVLNGRYSSDESRISCSLFEGLGIRHALSGSDAHMAWDIGVCYSLLPRSPASAASLREILNGALNIGYPRAEFERKAGIYLGSLIKARRRRKYWFLAKQFATLPLKSMRYGAKIILKRGEK